jgi:nucleoside-diphosphate-sugar epimerase
MGEGRQELSLVHARDLAQAVIAAGTSEATAGGTYHAAHGTPVHQRALMVAIGNAVGAKVRAVPLPAAIIRGVLHLTGAVARLRGRATLLDPSKVAELLAPAFTCSSAALARDAGWRAAIPLEDGLAETARWYAEAGWL